MITRESATLTVSVELIRDMNSNNEPSTPMVRAFIKTKVNTYVHGGTGSREDTIHYNVDHIENANMFMVVTEDDDIAYESDWEGVKASLVNKLCRSFKYALEETITIETELD